MECSCTFDSFQCITVIESDGDIEVSCTPDQMSVVIRNNRMFSSGHFGVAITNSHGRPGGIRSVKSANPVSSMRAMQTQVTAGFNCINNEIGATVGQMSVLINNNQMFSPDLYNVVTSRSYGNPGRILSAKSANSGSSKSTMQTKAMTALNCIGNGIGSTIGQIRRYFTNSDLYNVTPEPRGSPSRNPSLPSVNRLSRMRTKVLAALDCVNNGHGATIGEIKDYLVGQFLISPRNSARVAIMKALSRLQDEGVVGDMIQDGDDFDLIYFLNS